MENMFEVKLQNLEWVRVEEVSTTTTDWLVFNLYNLTSGLASGQPRKPTKA